MDISHTQRGFRYTDKMMCSYGETIELQDSSVAFNPSIWMRLDVPNSANEGSLLKYDPERGLPSGSTEVSVHLSAHQAWELRNRLDKMLEEHFYGDVRPGSEYWTQHKVDEFGEQTWDDYEEEEDND